MRTFIDGEVEWRRETDEAGAPPLQLTYASELMKNHATARVVDGSDRGSVVAIRDANGDPIVFSIGTDGALYAIVRRETHPTGWEQFDLTSGLGSRERVERVAVGQEEDGSFTLVVAVRRPGGGGVSTDVLATRALSNDTTKIDWQAFYRLWHRRGGKVVDRVTLLQVGLSRLPGEADGPGGPLVLLAAKEGGDQHYYQVDVDVYDDRPPRPWTRLDLPVQANHIVDVQVGKGRAGRTSPGEGVYVFSRYQGAEHLYFVSLPDRRGYVRKVELPVPRGLRSLAVLPEGEQGRTGLFYAGDGLHYLKPELQERDNTDPGTLTTIVPATAASGLDHLVAREDGHHVALWAVDGEKRLQYVVGRKQGSPGDAGRAPESWEPPIVILRDVDQVAPIRNQVRETNDLVVVQKRSRLRHLSQDPATTVWHDQVIPLRDTGELETFDCFATQITVLRDGLPVAAQRFELSASEWCEVVIDGESHHLGTDSAIPVETDIQGKVTVLRRADSIAPPLYRLTGGGLDRQVVNPAQKVREGLARLESADGIRNEKRQDGKPLLRRRVEPGELEAAAGGIRQLNAIGRDLPQDGGVSTSYLDGVDLAAAGRPPCWGMSLDASGLRYYEGEEAAAMMRGSLVAAGIAVDDDSEAWGVLRKIAGDVLAWIKNAVAEGFKFLVRAVNGAWQLMVQIGKEAYRFVITCLGHVYNAVHWVLKKTLGIDLDDVLQWVGFLFDWQDILRTHAVLTNVARQSLRYGSSQVDFVEKELDRAFDRFLRMAESLKPVGGERGRVSIRQASSDEAVRAKLPEKGRRSLDFATKSPAGSFGQYQVLHGGVLDGGPAVDEALGSDGELDRLFRETLQPFLSSVRSNVDSLGAEVRALFEGGDLSPDAILRTLASAAAQGMLKAVREVLRAFLRIFRQVLEKLANVVDSEIEIPFLSHFYRQVTGGRKFTLLEGLMLLAAIPATIGYKLVTGKAPFAEGTGGLDTDGHEALFQKLRESGLAADPEVASAVRVYSLVGGFTSAGLFLVGGVVDGKLAAAGSKKPGWLVAIFETMVLGCSVPVGNWSFGRAASWAYGFFGPVRGLFDTFAPAETVFSGAFQILQALIRAVFDLVKFIQAIGGRWEVVVWGACEDVLRLTAALLVGGAKIAVGKPKPILAALGVGATIVRGFVSLGRSIHFAAAGVEAQAA